MKAQTNKILYAVIIGLIVLFVILLIFAKARTSGTGAIDTLKHALW